MAKIEQISNLINSIYKESTGDTSITANDLSGLVAMGNVVVGNDGKLTDKFIGKLIDRIGLTVIRTMDVSLTDPFIMKQPYEFGQIIQKITTLPPEARDNTDYKIGDVNFVPTFADVSKPDTVVTYFKGADSWEFRVTIPYDQLATAFTSFDKMGAYLTSIMDSMFTAMQISLNNMNKRAVNNIVLEKKKLNSKSIRNLVTEYNTMFNASVPTGEEALNNTDFLKFMGKEMRNFVKYATEPSTLFNDGIELADGTIKKIPRTTARDDMHVMMATAVTSAYSTYLQADTFNKELTELPQFVEYPCWQAQDDRLKITGIPSTEENEDEKTTYTIENVAGIFADSNAIATGINKRRSGTFMNDIDGYTNYTDKAVIQYINDVSENCVVFTLN